MSRSGVPFWSCWENPSKSLRAAEKSQGAAEKNKEKVEVNCTGFSAEFFGSQSIEMFCFARKTKIQMLTTSSQSLTRIHQRLLLILRTLLLGQIFCLFFGRIEDTINCFRDLLTFKDECRYAIHKFKYSSQKKNSHLEAKKWQNKGKWENFSGYCIWICVSHNCTRL